MASVSQVADIWENEPYDVVYVRHKKGTVFTEIILVPHGAFRVGQTVIWVTPNVKGCECLHLRGQVSAGRLMAMEGSGVPVDTPLGTDVTERLGFERLVYDPEEERLIHHLAMYDDDDIKVRIRRIVKGDEIVYTWDGAWVSCQSELDVWATDACARSHELIECLEHWQMAPGTTIKGYAVRENEDYKFYMESIDCENDPMAIANFLGDVGFYETTVYCNKPLSKRLRHLDGLRDHLHDLAQQDPHVCGLRVEPIDDGLVDPLDLYLPVG